MSDDLSKVLADILPGASEAATSSTPEAKATEAAPAETPKAEDDKGQTTAEETKPETEAEAEDDSDEAEDDGETTDDKPKRKSGSAKLREKAERLERELAQYRMREAQNSQNADALAKAVQDRIGTPPRREDFESFIDYDRAATAYEVRKSMAVDEVKRDAAFAKQQAQTKFTELVEDFQEREAEARKRIPDYDTVMKQAASLETEAHVDQLILESDKGALLKYHLGQRPELVDRLNRMNPLQAAREIGRLEARLSYPQPKTATKAPPPVTPVSGGASVADGSDLDSDPSWQSFTSKRYGRK